MFANISDCVSFVQDGSNETDKFDMERKSCDPASSAAEQLNIIGFGCFHNTVGI